MKETIEIVLAGLNKINELETALRRATNAAAELSGEIEAIDQRITNASADIGNLGRSSAGITRTSRTIRAELGSESEYQKKRRSLEERARNLRNRGEFSQARDVKERIAERDQQRVNLRKTQRALTDRLTERRLELNEALQYRRELRQERTSMLKERKRREGVGLGIATETSRYQQELKDNRRFLASQARATVLRSRESSTDILFRRRAAQINRLITVGVSDRLSEPRRQRFQEIAAEIGAVQDRFRTLNAGLAALNKTAKASGESSPEIERQQRAFASARRQAAVELGRLVQDLLEINRTARGSRRTFDRSRRIAERANELFRVGGFSEDELKSARKAMSKAGEARKTGNIQEAKDILENVNNTVSAKERELALDKRIQNSEQRRILTIQKLNDKFQELQTTGASGSRMQAFEGLLQQLRQLADTKNMPAFERLAAQARAAAERIAIPKGALRGASSPIRGETFIPGSPKNLELSASTFDKSRRLAERADELLRTESITQRQRADIKRKLEAAGQARSGQRPDEAEKLLKKLERTIGALEREARRNSKIERERETRLTRETKAARSIETQQRQITELAGKGATGLPNFERARTAITRLPELLQSRNFDEFNRVLGDVTTYARFARDDLKLTSKYTKNTTKYENGIQKIANDILAGKKVTLEQVDKLNKFYEAQRGPIEPGGPTEPGGRRFRALPPAAPGSPLFGPGRPAAPGSPAFGIGVPTSVRPGLRGSQSIINGVPQPRMVELLGGSRTADEAAAAFQGAAAEGKRAMIRATEIAKTERKIGEERSKQASKIVGGVADAGRKIRSLFERDIIDRNTYNTFRNQLIGISRGVSSETASLARLAGTLRFRQRKIAELEPKGGRGQGFGNDPASRLANLQLDAENQLIKLNKLEAKGVDISARKNALQAELNRSQQAGYNISDKNLAIFKKQIDLSSRVARNERARIAGTTTRQLDPQAAQQRLNRILGTGQAVLGRLENLATRRSKTLESTDPRRIEAEQQLIKLRGDLNSASQAGYQITKDNLSALDATLLKSQQILDNDRDRNRLAKESLKIGRLSGEGRLSQLQRGTLTSMLGDLARSEVSAKVFRGGRSGEQSFSDIINTFNQAVSPVSKPTAPPTPATSKYTGPDAGREMEIDRYRGIFASLTSNPRFFNRMLQRLPREAITTEMAGKATDVAMQIERYRANPSLRPSARPNPYDLEGEILSAYRKATGTLPSTATELFDKIGSLFDSVVNRVTGGRLGGGSGGGGRPIPPNNFGPGDFSGRVDAARGDIKKLLGLGDVANLSKATTEQLQQFSQALTAARNGVKITDKSFRDSAKLINRIDDQIARRDPRADFLTRGLSQRNAQGVSEGIIGGAFPLLFGQGLGASVGGGLGGFLGGRTGGMLGFGLSLVGTVIGSQVDMLMQATQDAGNMLRDMVGNFDQIKESGLLASRQQEVFIQSLLEAGNKAAAYAVIQDELNRKIGVDGAARLKEAADAGDRMKRAMADLGVQMQLLVTGPLTDFLNAVSSAIERQNLENRVKRGLAEAPSTVSKAVSSDLAKQSGKSAQSPISYLSELLVGGIPGIGLSASTAMSLGRMLNPVDLTTTPSASLNAAAAKLERSASAKPQTTEQKRNIAIQNAQTLVAASQKQLDIISKQFETRDILKGFKQEARSLQREQQDLDRQSFELRRDYERQIGDIRKNIEDRVRQIREQNAQKELEIFVTQGQIREQQLKNAFSAIQGDLAGNDLAQGLADAVSSYLGAQLSAQNEIEQRRKQFEIEISNQQYEVEKFKAEIAKSVSRLNIDTAERVRQINLATARRNEDVASNSFDSQKKIAILKAQIIQNELALLEANQGRSLENAKLYVQQNPGVKIYGDILAAEQRVSSSISNAIRDAKLNLEDIKAVQAPEKLREIASVPTTVPSFAAVDQQITRGRALQQQLFDLRDTLTELAKGGNLKEFANRLAGFARGGTDELAKSLKNAREQLALVTGNVVPSIDAIKSAYADLIKSFESKNAIPQNLIALVNGFRDQQIRLEELIPTYQFYIDTTGSLTSGLQEARNAISDLLAPTSKYEKLLQRLNASGGINAGLGKARNEELLKEAKALDEYNAKLKALNALNDVAGGMTDSFIQFNKEIAKGGNLLESIQRFAENIADKALDVVLEFTLRPIQENLFKDLAKFMGIEAPQDPTLKPIQSIEGNVKNILDAIVSYYAQQEKIKLPGAIQQSNVMPSASLTPTNNAWLDTVAFAEGTWDPAAKKRRYNVGFGYNAFDNTKPHPERVWSANGYNSAAAGAYQFMPDTWKMINKGQNVPMLPAAQDIGALSLIQRRNVDPNAAISRQAASKLSPEWASFPTMSGNSYYGQPVVDYSSLEKFFKERLNFYNNQPGPTQPAPTPGPQSSKSSLGDQFVSQISGRQFEDIAGLQPLPLARMYRQMGRQVRRWTYKVQNEAEYFLKKEFGTTKPLIPQNVIDSTIERVRTITEAIQNFDPIELQFRELENRAKGSSGQARSKESSIGLNTFSQLFKKIERRIILDAANSMNMAGGSLNELGKNADLSNFIPENTKKFFTDGIRQLTSNDKRGFVRDALDRDFHRNFNSFFKETIRTIDSERGRSGPIRGGGGGYDSPNLPDIQRTPSGGADYLKQYRELQDLMDPPRITPGVSNQFDGAMVPLGDQLISKRFESIASAGAIQVVPKAMAESIAPIKTGAQAASEQLGNLSDKAREAGDQLKGVPTGITESVNKFQASVASGLQLFSGAAMGVGGAQMMKKGGTYNTLMGLASIFGGISTVSGGVKGLGKLFNLKGFAFGGRPDPYEPAVVGENGPEIWMPDRPGSIIPNENIYVPVLDDKGSSSPVTGRYARRHMASASSSEGDSGDSPYYGNNGISIPYQRSETSREIDRLEQIVTNPRELPPIKYETTKVNEYDFVTPDQLEASNARTAKITRNQTIRELADSMKTRKRLGL